MRIDNTEFAALNVQLTREPRFVFVLDFGDEDLAYFTSHADVIGLAGEAVYSGVLTTAAGTSQKLDPLKANSEIGTISFGILDDGLTELQKAKLGEGKGLRGKTVRFYVGFSGLDWNEYILATTQIVDSVSYEDNAYRFKTADIQRALREDIFTEVETNLAESIGPRSSYVRVQSTANLQMVLHPNVEGALFPGKRVGLVEIEGDDDDFEVIAYDEIVDGRLEVASTRTTTVGLTISLNSNVRLADASGFRNRGWGVIISNGVRQPFTWTGKNGNTLTGCEGHGGALPGAEVRDVWGRGALHTPVLSVDLSSDDVADSAPTVREFIYLEMPGPMAMYALLTGSLYGYPGETLPSHWHLGISPEFVRTADFLNIGDDLWDAEDRNQGLIVRFERLEEEDGKKFIEEQLARLMGLYMPIDSQGQIGLRRITGVLSDGGYARRLTEDHVVSAGALEHDMGALTNEIYVSWGWSIFDERFTRLNPFIDLESIDVHGRNDPLELEFRGLHGNRYSRDTIVDLLNGLRDRYAGPPLRLTLTLTPDQNDLEVGDIVRVDIISIKDYTGTAEDGHLNRNFEIQRVQTDWKTGDVRVTLFGSSQPAAELLPSQSGTAIPDAAYERGTEISPDNFPGKVTRTGEVTRIVGDITLAGDANLDQDGAFFWTPSDLFIEAGVRVTVHSNVGLLVRGFFACNGEIDGVGRGKIGALGCTAWEAGRGVFWSGNLGSVWNGINKGAPGYIDIQSSPQGGLGIYYHSNDRPYLEHVDSDATMSREGAVVRGQVSSVPASLKPRFSPVVALPLDLRGGSGSGGGVSGVRTIGNDNIYLEGGAIGGDGGAGLMIVSRGAQIGQQGRINLSGTAGAAGKTVTYGDSKVATGSGGPGGPGACVFFIDGVGNNPPTLTSGRCVANGGDLTWSGVRWNGDYARADKSPHYWSAGHGPAPMGGDLEDYGARGAVMWEAAFRVITLAPPAPVEPEEPPTAGDPLRLVLAELTNTPRSANANLSTIEVAAIPPADDAGYSYSLVEYRPKGSSGWFEVGPASPEATFVVPSDGETYEVRARGVSKSGRVNPAGVTAEITTTHVRAPGDDSDNPEDNPDDVVPAPPVNGLELFEQGNDAVFGGRDAKFVWRKTSVTEWYEMGQEGRQGASSGGLDQYFRDYQVEVWADVAGSLSLVRTEWVNDPQFVYTYEKNAEDHARETDSVGAWRAFEVRVYCRGRQNQISAEPAKLAVENPPPALPVLLVSAGFRTIQVDFDLPEDLDYRDLRVWMSQTSGFTPGPDNLVAQQYGGPIVISGLADGTQFYFRIATSDAFGPGETSQEFSATTVTLSLEDVGDLGPDLDAIRADVAQNADDIASQALQLIDHAGQLNQHATELGQHATELGQHAQDLVQNAQGIAENATAIATMGGRVDDAETGIAANSSAIIGLDGRVTDAEGEITAQASQITQLQSDVSDAQSGVDANAGAVSALDTRVTTAEGQITTHSNQITGLQTGLNDAENDIAANSNAVAALDTRVATAEGEIDAQSSQITQLQTDVSNAQDGVDANAGALSTLDTRVTSAEGTISTHSTQIDSLQTGLTAAEGDIDANAGAVSALDTRVTSAEGEITSQGSQITQLQGDVSDAQAGVDANSTALQGLDTRVGVAEGEIDSHSAQITQLGNQVTDLDADVQGNSTAISGLDSRVTSAEGQITSQAGDITQLQSDVSTAQGTADDAITAASGNTTAINGLTTRVTQTEDELDAQSREITTLKTEVSVRDVLVFRKATEPTEADLPPPPADVPVLDLDFTTETFLVWGIPEGSIWYHTGEGNKPYVYQNGQWVDTQDQLGVATANAVDQLDTRVTQNEDGIAAQANQVTQLESRVDGVETDTSANSTAINALDTRVTQNENETTANSQAITQIGSDLDTVEGETAANAQAVNALDTRVSDAEGDIAAQATQLSSISTTVDGHTATIDQNSTSINGLEAQWVLNVEAGGRVAGIQLANGQGATSGTFIADQWAFIPSGGASPHIPAPQAGLNIIPADRMGFYDGAKWRAYITNTGEAYFGDGGEKFFSFNGTDVVLGRDSLIQGVDMFNGQKLVYHVFFKDAVILDHHTTEANNGIVDHVVRGLRVETSGGANTQDSASLVHATPDLRAQGKDLSLIKKFRIKVGVAFGSLPRGMLSYDPGESSSCTLRFWFFTSSASGGPPILLEVKDTFTYQSSDPTKTIVSRDRVVTLTFRNFDGTQTDVVVDTDSGSFQSNVLYDLTYVPNRLEVSFDLDAGEITVSMDDAWSHTFTGVNYSSLQEVMNFSGYYSANPNDFRITASSIPGSVGISPRMSSILNDYFFIED